VRLAHRLALGAALLPIALAAGGRLAGDSEAPRRRGAGVEERRAATAARAPRATPTATPDAATLRGGATAMPRAEDVGAQREPRPTAPATRRIALETPPRALGAALAIAGFDPAGPRALELWRLDGARAARVALGRSAADGALVFPPLLLPADAVELVAAPRGAGPGADEASSAVLVRRDPAAPRAALALDAGALVLRVEPAEARGEIVVARGLADAERPAEEIARLRVAADADRRGAPLAIALPHDAAPAVRVAQRLTDGRLSPWQDVAFEPATPIEEIDHAETQLPVTP
jgi:hypothetical protein